VTRFLRSPKKTLQGLYDVQVWASERAPSRRAMHAAVVEAGWAAEALMPHHRAVIAREHRGRGRAVVSLDWTYVHHERGPQLWGINTAWDHVEQRSGLYQPVLTAVVAHRELRDGLEVVVQEPQRYEEALAYLKATLQAGYDQMEAARTRLWALWHQWPHRLAYKKRTEIAVESVQQRDHERHGPPANSAFDTGVLTVELARCIAEAGQHWVSDVECARHSQWQGHWRRVEEVATVLRSAHPESFRAVCVRGRHGAMHQSWACPKGVRLKRSGRKRLVIVHEQEQVDDAPRGLLTDAQHGESGRVLDTWSYRWAAAIFHAFGKQVTGVETAQVRTEEAVKRHLRVSGVAQSLVQRVPAAGATSERLACAQREDTVGQRVRTIARDALHGLLKLVEQLFAQGHSCMPILEVLMPA
jgi:hypothetical protein